MSVSAVGHATFHFSTINTPSSTHPFPGTLVLAHQLPAQTNCTMAANGVSAHPEEEKLEAREMRGDGVYTANTKGCFDVINTAGVRGAETK